MPLETPWYTLINDDSLEQGEILPDFPVVTPILQVADGKIGEVVQFNALEYDMVVLTQTCDLVVDSKVENIILAPCPTVTEFSKQNLKYSKLETLLEVSKGRHEGLHLLRECSLVGLEFESRIVNFRQVVTVARTIFLEIAPLRIPRARLNSPYREHLSHEFAGFISRVALPTAAIEDPKKK